MNVDITQNALCRAVQRDWTDQTNYPQYKGWQRISERLTGIYGLLLWSGADREIISDCETLMQIALQHNMDTRND